MIGDSPENDLLPAKSLGITTFLIDRKNNYNVTPGIDCIITSLDEFSSIMGVE